MLGRNPIIRRLPLLTLRLYRPDEDYGYEELNQKGTQEHICDILEGGRDAFEKRASKYFRAK